MQNTPEKAQLDWVENSKLFHKHDEFKYKISMHSNTRKNKRNIKKLQKPRPNKYIKNISIKVALK